MKFLILFGVVKFLILFGLLGFSQSYKDTINDSQRYCYNKALCYRGTHIACNFTSSTWMWCNGQELYIDKAQVLKAHNDYRQKIASGGYPPLPTAARMTELQWSDDLELTASYNARRCLWGHDECRSTQQFLYAGQNIIEIYWSGDPMDDAGYKQAVTNMIDAWFYEYKDCPPEQINSYDNPQKMIGHFTQMVKDQVTHIGCSYIYYEKYDQAQNITWDKIYLVCNYGRGNVYREPTYVSGSPGSQCTQRSSNYPALCSVY